MNVSTLVKIIIGIVFIFFAIGVCFYSYQLITRKTIMGSQESHVAVSDVNTVRYEVLTTASTTYWRSIFPVTSSMKMGDVLVEASIASSAMDRARGLSGTPYLPNVVVKLFIFDFDGTHSFWMKDMNYPIDILWADSEGKINYIEHNVHPSTYPEIFIPPTPARYVVETVAGFSELHNINEGSYLMLPAL